MKSNMILKCVIHMLAYYLLSTFYINFSFFVTHFRFTCLSLTNVFRMIGQARKAHRFVIVELVGHVRLTQKEDHKLIIDLGWPIKIEYFKRFSWVSEGFSSSSFVAKCLLDLRQPILKIFFVRMLGKPRC